MDGPRRIMANALKSAELEPDQVQYLNAHGTSTPLGDKNESEAVKAAFGAHAKKLTVNSTKSMTGHLLGGAGGLESVLTVLALHHRSEEHTSELQSLMRISYAVFCLKKKTIDCTTTVVTVHTLH